jgi:2Fe-2S ferredoxin
VPRLIVIGRDGKQRELAAGSNLSLMEAIRDAGVDGIFALCGGVCSCATCHVHVDPEFASLLPPMSKDEDALLDSSSQRDNRSRLSCQIRFDESLSGLRVTVAQEDP